MKFGKTFKSSMYNLNSDVFVLTDSNIKSDIIIDYKKHLKFCLKREFYVGMPYSCSDDLVTEFEDIFQSNSIEGHIFFYFDFKPHQSIQSIIDNHKEEPRWSQHIHLLPNPELQYGSYKDELWDLHLLKYTVTFHELDRAKEFLKNPELIYKLNARGGLIGISLSRLSSRKLTSLIANNSVNFINTQFLNIQSKEYVEEQKSRRLFEELILNSSNLDQSSDVLD